jgi:hypothetical protein
MDSPSRTTLNDVLGSTVRKQVSKKRESRNGTIKIG